MDASSMLSLRGMLPMLPPSICFVETCPNPVECTLPHLSLRSPLSVPFPFATHPSPFLRLPFPSHHPAGHLLPPISSYLPYHSSLQLQAPPQSSAPSTSTAQCAPQADSARQPKNTVISSQDDEHTTYVHQQVKPEPSESSQSSQILEHSSSTASRDPSESPKSSAGSSLPGHSILASILRGEDFCSEGSGTSSSGGLSPHSDQLDVERSTPNTLPPPPPAHHQSQILTPAYRLPPAVPAHPTYVSENGIASSHQGLLQPMHMPPLSGPQQHNYHSLQQFHTATSNGLSINTDRACLTGVRRLSSPSSQSSQSSGSPCSQFAPLPPNSQVACAICDDKASGFHYGVVSCEGCKGFFRRTVQRNMSYRCHKANDCIVSRTTRNRCQSCRYHKCIKKGMRVESVRPERSRKRKLKEEQEEAALKETARIQQTIEKLLQAHTSTTLSHAAITGTEDALNVHGTPEGHRLIHKFCHMVPGFTEINAADQALLFQHSALEIMMLRTAQACYDSRLSDTSAKGELPASVDKLRDTFAQLDVCHEEVALLAAICLICPTRPGLQNVDEVEKKQEPLLEALRVQVQLRRAQFHNVFAKLLMRVSDLRTAALKCNQQMQNQLNSMHQNQNQEKQMAVV